MNKNLIKPIKPLHHSIMWWQTISMYLIIGTIIVLGIITGWYYWRLQQLHILNAQRGLPHEQQAAQLQQTSEQLASLKALEYKINHCGTQALIQLLSYCSKTLPPSMRLTTVSMPNKKTFVLQAHLKNSQEFKQWLAQLQQAQPERHWIMQTLEPDIIEGTVQCLKVSLKGSV